MKGVIHGLLSGLIVAAFVLAYGGPVWAAMGFGYVVGTIVERTEP